MKALFAIYIRQKSNSNILFFFESRNILQNATYFTFFFYILHANKYDR